MQCFLERIVGESNALTFKSVVGQDVPACLSKCACHLDRRGICGEGVGVEAN